MTGHKAITVRRLLIINPNLTTAVTSTLGAFAQARLALRAADASAIAVDAIDARFGAAYISSETSFAIAAHGLLDAYANWVGSRPQPPDATLIGCFGDPGLLALRENTSRPVVGLAEAAFRQAATHGRFAIVTGGQRWQPMLRRLAQSLDFDRELVAVHTVAPTGGQLAADPDGALQLLTKACLDAANWHKVDALILGGAGLAGLAERIQPQVPVPVIDSVIAGIDRALSMIDALVDVDSPSTEGADPRSAAGSGGNAAGDATTVAADEPTAAPPAAGVDWQGLSPELARWLHGRI